MTVAREGKIAIADRKTGRVKQRGSKATAEDAVVSTGSPSDRAKSDFLGLSCRWATPSMEEIGELRKGVEFRTLDGLNTIFPGTTYRIVPKSTLASLKKRSDRLPPEQSDRVYQAGKVIGFAMTLFRDEGKVREFLTRRHPMLEDERPIDVALESGAGADMVLNILGRGAYGGGA